MFATEARDLPDSMKVRKSKKNGTDSDEICTIFLTAYTGSGATKKYITTKWQALPSITKIWKISWEPKFLCLASKSGTFKA